MSRQYDRYHTAYEKRQRNQSMEWDRPRHAYISLALGSELHKRLMLESEMEERRRKLAQGPSLAERVILSFGVWLANLRRRL
jgi:hypothetical protein